MNEKLTSNLAKIKDPEAVENILCNYLFRFEVFVRETEAGGGWTLEMAGVGRGTGVGDSARGEPLALPTDQVPNPWQHPMPESPFAEMIALLQERGQEGFAAMLLDLAPFLETELKVRAVSDQADLHVAQEWLVRPGAQKLEHAEIRRSLFDTGGQG